MTRRLRAICRAGMAWIIAGYQKLPAQLGARPPSMLVISPTLLPGIALDFPYAQGCGKRDNKGDISRLPR